MSEHHPPEEPGLRETSQVLEVDLFESDAFDEEKKAVWDHLD